MDLAEIKSFMPHREPMLLIEHAEITGEGEAYATYRIKEDEFFTRGHFPGNPVMPGVLIIEALAQVGAVAILGLPENKGKTAYFAGIDKARFKQKVCPGDVLLLETKIVKVKGPIGIGEATATVNGKVAAKAELTFAIGE